MIGTSTGMFLLIDEASMSMWIFFESGEKASTRPVTRSSKRAPTHSMTSQSCMHMLASSEPCMPTMPMKFLCEAPSAPSPMSVSVVGKPVVSTRLVRSCEAAGPALTTPPPA